MSLEPAQFDAVVERASLPYMKAREQQFAPPRMPLTPAPGVMIRRGEAGKSGEILTAEEQARIDERARADLRRLGSELPYDALFGG